MATINVLIGSSSGIQEYSLELTASSAPTIVPISPENGDLDVSVSSLVILEITDDDYDVKSDDILIKIEGTTVFSNETFFAPFEVDSYYGTIVGGYRLEFQRTSDFDSYSIISVYAEAYDVAGNFTTLNYSFETEDVSAPVVYDEFPTDGSEGVGRDKTKFYFKILDEKGVKLDTIDVLINGTDVAFTAGAISSPFDGVDAYFQTQSDYGLEGYFFQFDYTSSWENYGLIIVDITADDIDGNTLSDTFSFRIEDNVSSIVSNLSPADSSTGIGLTENISFDIYDDGSGIDLDFLSINIEGNPVFSNPSFLAPYNGPSSSITSGTIDGYPGYSVVIDNTNAWTSFDTINTDVSGQDNYGNLFSFSWSFQTIDTSGPTYVPGSVSPSIDASNISPNSNISITIYDTGAGIDFSTIRAYVDEGSGEVMAYNGSSFVNGFNGPNSAITYTLVGLYDGYNIIIDKETPYQSGATITARVVANDKDGN